ncbi:MAG: tetratricopeptide repeat protein [Saprospirales bacterium]|nr:tetratricopeptide repeat protein [Saprospirales bacterium]
MKTTHIFLLLAGFTLLSACGQDNGNGEENTPAAGAPDPSISQLNLLLEKTPNDPELYYQRAKIYYDLDGYDEAIQDVQKALSFDSVNVNYLHLLADVYLDYYQSFRALKTMEKAAGLHPQHIPTLLKLSEFQLILKQPEQALKTLEKIRAIDPQNAEMFYMGGLVFEDQGETDKAIGSFQSAVEIDPELIEGWINLGKLWASKKEPIAIQFFDNALRVDSTNVVALHEKAYYLSNTLNDLEGALALYKKIIVSHPQYAEAYFNAGLLYLDMDSIDRATQQFDLNIKVDPTFPQAYYYRGLCAEMKGDAESAVKDYEAALNLAPDYDKAREALDKLK